MPNEVNLTPEEWRALEKDLDRLKRRQVDLVPVFTKREIPGWPKNPYNICAEHCMYRPIVEALTTYWDTWVHIAAYSCPTVPVRLNGEALGQVPVTMHWGILDIDCDWAKENEQPVPDAWRRGEWAKVQQVQADHPGIFEYDTKNGYRLLGRLPAPIELRSAEQAKEEWTFLYQCYRAYLARNYGIQTDPACKDWNRFYAVPHCTRLGKREKRGSRPPEDRFVGGDPRRIGTWHPQFNEEDLSTAIDLCNPRNQMTDWERYDHDTNPSIDAGKGIFFELLAARNLIGKQIGPDKYQVICPAVQQHGKKGTRPEDTVLYTAKPGTMWGHMWCSHGNCGHVDWQWGQWKALFTEEEIERARDRCGLNDAPKPVELTEEEGMSFLEEDDQP